MALVVGRAGLGQEPARAGAGPATRRRRRARPLRRLRRGRARAVPAVRRSARRARAQRGPGRAPPRSRARRRRADASAARAARCRRDPAAAGQRGRRHRAAPPAHVGHRAARPRSVRDAPVLLVLEDVHWADAPTLFLIRHLVRAGANARLLLVATIRDAEADRPAAVAETVADIVRSEGVVRVRLTGLDDGEVAEFVRLVTGAEADREVTEAIADLTAGNAFLLTELWRELIQSQAIEVGATAVRLARPLGDIATPETVRDVVTQRSDPRRACDRRGARARCADRGRVRARHDTPRCRPARRRRCSTRSTRPSGAASSSKRRGEGSRTDSRTSWCAGRCPTASRLARRAEIHLRVAHALERRAPHGDARGRLTALAYHYAEAAVGGRCRARRLLQPACRRVGDGRSGVRRGGRAAADGAGARCRRAAGTRHRVSRARVRLPSRGPLDGCARCVPRDRVHRASARRQRAPRSCGDRLRGGLLAPGDP